MSLNRIIDSSEQAAIRQAYRYRLIHLWEKCVRYKNHLTFLLRCQKRQIVPNGLRVRLPVKSEKEKRITEWTSQSLLRERIGEARKAKVQIECQINTSEVELKRSLSDEQWSKLNSGASASCYKLHLRCDWSSVCRATVRVQITIGVQSRKWSTIMQNPRHACNYSA